MTTSIDSHDIVRSQIVWRRLLSIVDEQAKTLLRAAFSPIVRECNDLSTGIFDLRGRMIAQAPVGTPGHINTMARSVDHFIAAFPVETMQPGDVYVTNDPWLGTGHLNDYVVVTPTFHGGRPVALFASTAHITDVGGIGLSPEGQDVYSEGVLVPMSRLVDKGVLNATLVAIAKANSRLPTELEGDIFSLVACNEVACRALQGLLEEVRLDSLDTIADWIIDSSEAAVRKRVADLADGSGSYSMTVDGADLPVELNGSLRIEGERVVFTWHDVPPPLRYGINVPRAYTAAMTSYALGCVIAPDVPNNHGSLSVFEMEVAPNTLLSAERPNPVSARHVIGQLLPDVVFGCFEAIVPGLVPAESASAVWTLTFRGEDFVNSVVTNGGTGARPGIDGLSTTAFPSAVQGTPVEVVEAMSPLVFWRRELRAGSGGRGRQNGGDGQVIEVGTSTSEPVSLFLALDRTVYAARGRDGGENGALGELAFASGRPISGKGRFEIEPGDRVVIQTPGGGGYGSPSQRSAAAREADARNELV